MMSCFQIVCLDVERSATFFLHCGLPAIDVPIIVKPQSSAARTA